MTRLKQEELNDLPPGTRQIHQGLFGTVTWDDMNKSEPYPQDHVEIAEALADIPMLDRLQVLISLHTEYDVELLEHLVHLEHVRRSVKMLIEQKVSR